MPKIATARQIFKYLGVKGIYYIVLKKLRIQIGETWLTDRLVRPYNLPYINIRKTLKCPRCRGLLEKTAEGLICHQCQDVYV
jgi:hypothetical protein